jgi:hypothetical protein
MAYLAYLKTQRGEPEPHIWHDLESSEPYYSLNSPRGLMHERFIFKYELKAGEEKLPIAELVKLYPPPKRPPEKPRVPAPKPTPDPKPAPAAAAFEPVE